MLYEVITKIEKLTIDEKIEKLNNLKKELFFIPVQEDTKLYEKK